MAEGRPDERRTRGIDGGGARRRERESRFTVGEGRKQWDAGRNGGGIAGERRKSGVRAEGGERRNTYPVSFTLWLQLIRNRLSFERFSIDRLREGGPRRESGLQPGASPSCRRTREPRGETEKESFGLEEEDLL